MTRRSFTVYSCARRGEPRLLGPTFISAIRNATGRNLSFVIFAERSLRPAVSRIIERVRSAGVTFNMAPRPLRRSSPIRAAIEHDTRGDVIFIHPGVELPPAWDTRLQYAAYADERAAAVSPMLDASPLFALFPGRGQEITLAQGNELALALGEQRNYELPVFYPGCVYFRRDALRSIGALLRDHDDFHIALSHRFRAAGFTSAVCDHLYITDRNPLANWAMAGLPAREIPHPHPLTHLRAAAQAALRRKWIPSGRPLAPVVLHISHSWGGGLEKWIADYGRADTSRRHLVLKSIGMVGEYGQALALFDHPGSKKPLHTWRLTYAIQATATANLEYRRILHRVVEDYGVDSVIVSSVIGHSLDALETGLPTVIVLHDYYPFCPALNIHFKGVCRSCTPARLTECFRHNPFNRLFGMADAAEWVALRDRYMKLIASHAIPMVAPTRSVLRHLSVIFPRFPLRGAKVIGHGVEVTGARPIAPANGTRLRVVILGLLSPQKGRELLRSVIPLARSFADFYLIGAGKGGALFADQPGVMVIERYNPIRLARLLANVKPDVALALSVVPETFGYTLAELQALVIPCVATNLGSYAERIQDGVTGFLTKPDAGAIVKALTRLHRDRSLLERARSALRASPVKSLSMMVREYDRILPPSGFSARGYASTLPRAPEAVECLKLAENSRPFTRAVMDRFFHDAIQHNARLYGVEKKRVLLIRCGRDMTLKPCLRAARAVWGEKIAFLCHHTHAGRYRGWFPWLRVITTADRGFLHWDTLDAKAIAALRRHGADVALICAPGKYFSGFENIIEIAEKSGARKVYFLGGEGALHPVR